MKDDSYDPLIALGNCLMLALLCLLALCSCRSKTQTVVETRTDTRVQKIVEVKTDTVRVEIPAQSAERTTRDTVSRLETAYATSLAEVLADGSLHHTLANKNTGIRIPVQHRVERVDSLVYVEKPVTVTVPAGTSWWTRVMEATWWLMAAVAVGFGGLWWLGRRGIL